MIGLVRVPVPGNGLGIALAVVILALNFIPRLGWRRWLIVGVAALVGVMTSGVLRGPNADARASTAPAESPAPLRSAPTPTTQPVPTIPAPVPTIPPHTRWAEANKPDLDTVHSTTEKLVDALGHHDTPQIAFNAGALHRLYDTLFGSLYADEAASATQPGQTALEALNVCAAATDQLASAIQGGQPAALGDAGVQMDSCDAKQRAAWVLRP